jgi:iron complex transport system substrate-binding protein
LSDARGGAAERGRRVALGALIAAPLALGAAFGRRARSALVGARDLGDSQAAPGGFPKRLVGPTGEISILEAPPRRIVSTYLGGDEILSELVARERVIAVSAYADDPSTSNCRDVFPPDVPRLRTDPETIVALDPDIVCVAGFTEPDTLRLLAGAGLRLLRWSRFESFADVTAELALFGAALGAEARAAELTADLQRLLADLERRLTGVRRVRVVYYDPPTYTMGRGTLVDEILARAGAHNAVNDLGVIGPGQIGIETVIALDPEVIVMPRYADNVSALRVLSGSPVWRQVPAVRDGRVVEIPGAWIATVSHHAARGLERLARLLHPEAF